MTSFDWNDRLHVTIRHTFVVGLSVLTTWVSHGWLLPCFLDQVRGTKGSLQRKDRQTDTLRERNAHQSNPQRYLLLIARPKTKSSNLILAKSSFSFFAIFYLSPQVGPLPGSPWWQTSSSQSRDYNNLCVEVTLITYNFSFCLHSSSLKWWWSWVQRSSSTEFSDPLLNCYLLQRSFQAASLFYYLAIGLSVSLVQFCPSTFLTYNEMHSKKIERFSHHSMNPFNAKTVHSFLARLILSQSHFYSPFSHHHEMIIITSPNSGIDRSIASNPHEKTRKVKQSKVMDDLGF